MSTTNIFIGILTDNMLDDPQQFQELITEDEIDLEDADFGGLQFEDWELDETEAARLLSEWRRNILDPVMQTYLDRKLPWQPDMPVAMELYDDYGDGDSAEEEERKEREEEEEDDGGERGRGRGEEEKEEKEAVDRKKSKKKKKKKEKKKKKKKGIETTKYVHSLSNFNGTLNPKYDGILGRKSDANSQCDSSLSLLMKREVFQ